MTYDAVLLNPASGRIVKRDMVALDEYKTAIPGAKFDFQVLYPGAEFMVLIEQNMEKEEEQYVINEIAGAWMKGRIAIGAKTGRGYGHTQGITASSAMFDLSDSGQLEKWLAFNMYDPDDANWEQMGNGEGCDLCLQDLLPSDPARAQLAAVYKEHEIILSDEGRCRISLELELNGGISIRQYTTETGEEDYRQLTGGRLEGEEEDEKLGTPVIPGTSWAGAFRAQLARLDPDFRMGMPLAEQFFGNAKNNRSESSKTRVSFSESRITGGHWKLYTRNAIDRFTGGTIDGALYTEKTYYNGSCTLEIICEFGEGSKRGQQICPEDRGRFAAVLAAAILDLDRGYMAVGGLTAVGRGLFTVKNISVDGKQIGIKKCGASEAHAALTDAICGSVQRRIENGS